MPIPSTVSFTGRATKVVEHIQGQTQKGQWHPLHACRSYFPNKYSHVSQHKDPFVGVSVCTNTHTSRRAQQACLHTHTHSNREGSDTRRQWLWLMHQARGPAVVGVCVLITLSVCFISSWWSLMNKLALRVPASLVVLSPDRVHTSEVTIDTPPPSLNHTPPPAESPATDWQVCLSGC